MSHLMSAAAAAEALVCVEAINNNIIPPTTNLEVIDPECEEVKHVKQPIKTEVNTVLNNSFGFGGENTAMVFRKFSLN